MAADRMRAAELARTLSRRRTLESRLQAMQARVEPQFLFNTLAQVRELYERDAVVAGRVLDDLISYLRAALPHLRESSSTLGQEIALARAYLDIMQVRLGERLEFSIDRHACRQARRHFGAPARALRRRRALRAGTDARTGNARHAGDSV
jgi:sensor histidine kinase YesM